MSRKKRADEPMSRIQSIAVNTFRESVREKLLYIVLVFGGILVLGTFVLSPLSIGAARGKIIMDLGLAAISLLGVLAAVFAGSTLLHKEIEKKAIYMVLTRPVSRLEYILGKFSGIVLALGLLAAMMTAFMSVMIWVGGGGMSVPVLLAVYLSILEMAVISSIVIFFSTFTTPVLTSFFTISVFVAGSLSGDLREFSRKFGGAAMKHLMEAFYLALPNLKIFNLRHEAVYGLQFCASDIALATVYALAYCSTVLYFSYLVFRRREFS